MPTIETTPLRRATIATMLVVQLAVLGCGDDGERSTGPSGSAAGSGGAGSSTTSGSAGPTTSSGGGEGGAGGYDGRRDGELVERR